MATFTLTLDPKEKAYLEELLDEDLRDTRVEVRRTDTPEFRDELLQRENLIRGLLERLQGGKLAEEVGPRS